jgi:hypothetical protein
VVLGCKTITLSAENPQGKQNKRKKYPCFGGMYVWHALSKQLISIFNQTIFSTVTDTDIDYIRTRIPSISIVVRYCVNRNVPSSSKLNDVINFSSCEDVDVHHYIPHYDILEDVLLQILLVDKTV